MYAVPSKDWGIYENIHCEILTIRKTMQPF